MFEIILTAVLTKILESAIMTGLLAYIGPGAAVTSIGALIAIIAAVLIAIVGFLWYPIRRFLRKRKKKDSEAKSESN